tara:strand:- start:5906 stop:6907 length:1002 start_codon:yes stop_codon:yes gene_type:complete
MSYKRFDSDDVIVSAESVTTSAWSGNVTTLSSFYTSSTQYNSTSGDYYINIFNQDPSGSGEEIQFTVGYANKDGKGSLLYNSAVAGKSPSDTIYGQYRTLVLGDEESDFIFGSGDNTFTGTSFYALSVDRGRYKEKILPGSFELVLKTANNGNITITDTSTSTTTDTFTDAGRVYELKADVSSSVATSGSYGKLLPDVGLILLNEEALDAPIAAGGLALGTGNNTNTNDQNSKKLYNAIVSGSSFKLSSQETISSNFVFARARNSEFNYSTNPSILTGSGELRHDVLIDSPETYVTSVGLYNDNQDLLAVAKLSRPLLKNSTKEALIRIKLDY